MSKASPHNVLPFSCSNYKHIKVTFHRPADNVEASHGRQLCYCLQFIITALISLCMFLSTLKTAFKVFHSQELGGNGREKLFFHFQAGTLQCNLCNLPFLFFGKNVQTQTKNFSVCYPSMQLHSGDFTRFLFTSFVRLNDCCFRVFLFSFHRGFLFWAKFYVGKCSANLKRFFMGRV